MQGLYFPCLAKKRRHTPMCHCLESSASFAEPLHRCPSFLRNLVQANSEKYPAIFSSELLEAPENQFTKTNENSFARRNGSNFVCNECGTKWYLEWACEQTSWPIFGVKTNAEHPTNDDDVAQARRDLLSLLLGGKSEATCITAGCTEHALQNIYLCSSHYGFPW